MLAWKLSDVRLWMRTAANHNLAIYRAGSSQVNCTLYLEYYHFTTLPDSCIALFKKVARNGSCLFNRVILCFWCFTPTCHQEEKLGVDVSANHRNFTMSVICRNIHCKHLIMSESSLQNK